MIQKINWLFIVAGTIAMMFIMMRTGETLKTPLTPLGILNLEFAYSGEQASNVLAAWEAGNLSPVDNIQAAIKNTWLDFIFLFFYALFLFYSCKTISESFTGTIYGLGRFLAIGALNAGLLDIAENTGMLLMLHGYISDSISIFTAICAGLKWSLAITALLYVVIAGPFYLYKKWK